MLTERNVEIKEKELCRTEEYLMQGCTIIYAAIALAITGMLNPAIGALIHNAGSVAVIINSALLLKQKSRKQW